MALFVTIDEGVGDMKTIKGKKGLTQKIYFSIDRVQCKDIILYYKVWGPIILIVYT